MPSVKTEKLGKVFRITLDRPEAFNALNSAVLDEMIEAVGQASDDPEVWVVIITGSGDRAFIAGADIKEMSEKTPQEARAFSKKGHRLCLMIEEMEKPVIAAVNGVALGGGCEVAMASDIRIASEKARLGQPEVGLGVLPGWGGTVRLGKIVGEGIAREMIFTGKRLTAEEALKVGLVNAVFPSDQVQGEALKMANAIAELAPIPIGYAKRSMNAARFLDTETACELEQDVFSLCFSTEDQKAGMAAFVNKAKAEFKGR